MRPVLSSSRAVTANSENSLLPIGPLFLAYPYTLFFDQNPCQHMCTNPQLNIRKSNSNLYRLYLTVYRDIIRFKSEYLLLSDSGIRVRIRFKAISTHYPTLVYLSIYQALVLLSITFIDLPVHQFLHRSRW
jgi:hypothetical protein